MKKIYEEKIINLRKLLEEKNKDAILIYDHKDILYLTGFKDKENNSVAIITKDKLLFLTDGRFINQFNNEVEGFDLVLIKNQLSKFFDIKKIIKKEKISNILINYQIINHQEYLDLEEKNINIGNSYNIINKYRRNKSEEEIKIIKKACQIAEESLLSTLDKIKEGITEKEIKKIICEEMEKRGAEGEAFPTIIASGKNNGASPHARPTERKVKEGEFITIDFGALYKNYQSDITRTIAVGKVSQEMKDIYNQTLKAKNECVKMLKPGQRICDVHNRAREIIAELGYEFLHGLGHGIGLETHENPFLNAKNEGIFEINDVHTIEPGIYVPGICGVRIEDDYLITQNGYECLTPNITTELITV